MKLIVFLSLFLTIIECESIKLPENVAIDILPEEIVMFMNETTASQQQEFIDAANKHDDVEELIIYLKERDPQLAKLLSPVLSKLFTNLRKMDNEKAVEFLTLYSNKYDELDEKYTHDKNRKVVEFLKHEMEKWKMLDVEAQNKLREVYPKMVKILEDTSLQKMLGIKS